jgi:hypothetical protein
MDTGVSFPLYVFEKDDCSMFLVERPDRFLYHIEPIDIEYEEYLFWDSAERGVSVSVKHDKVSNIGHCDCEMTLREAFVRHSRSLGSPWT